MTNDYEHYNIADEDSDHEETDNDVAFNLEMSRMVAILDGGATRSAAGIQPLEWVQEAYGESGREVQVGTSDVESSSPSQTVRRHQPDPASRSRPAPSTTRWSPSTA